MTIAIISDIHGNSWALEAVIADIRKKNINEIYDLGDSLYGPLDPKGTFELIISNSIQSLSGNEDRILVENLNSTTRKPTVDYSIRNLNGNAIEWLKHLPKTRKINSDILLCHGTPWNDSEYLVEQLNPNFVGIKDTATLNGMLKGIDERIIICGHSHCPRIVDTGTKLIINTGSVGLPAYDDDSPIFHKMENFSPMARYCILDTNGNVKIEQIAIAYDFDKAAKCAKENGRNDWEKWIETGIA